MKKLLVLFIACVALFSCQQYEFDFDAVPKFSAVIEDISSKTTLDENNFTLWEADDQVSVFSKSKSNLRYKVADGTEGNTFCDLIYAENVAPAKGDAISHNVAYYPFSENVMCEQYGTSYQLNVELPSTQLYSHKSYPSGSFPMVAVSDGLQLAFKNVCGTIKLQVKGTSKIASVEFSGNNNEKLSGSAIVTAYVSDDPKIVLNDDASTSITLDCANGVQLSAENATEFMLTVPPTEFKSGFTFVLKEINGQTYTLSTTKRNTVNRSAILVMPEMTLKNEESNAPVNGIVPFTTATVGHEGLTYIWDEAVIPEITINMSSSEWNKLLTRYDEFDHNVDYFHADFTYKKGSDVIVIQDGGIRLRGNTSRRRPEGNYGQSHNSKNPDWHHCHFGINFRKFHKDDDHELKGIRKMNLKWFKDDPCYVRELYCYDLFRRYGIWTSAFSTYARVWLQIDNETPAYLGVYDMIEPVDDEFISKRLDGMFESDGGFLWKCCYGEGGAADLKTDGNNSVPSWKMNWDQDNGVNYTYEFKGKEKNFEKAKIQLGDFMQKLNGKSDESFYKWIKEVCDVEFLLKTYAVNVAVGMWDDHWGNGNNFYLYFNTTDQYNYKVFFIPYDYDNTLGTSSIVSDAGRQDPYDWGNTGLLMERLMRFDDFRQIYKNALQELVNPSNALFHMDASVPRIKAWQQKISPYVSNDTGEDMSIYDKPASWGNCNFYRLMDTGSNNYFKVKTETINNMR